MVAIYRYISKKNQELSALDKEDIYQNDQFFLCSWLQIYEFRDWSFWKLLIGKHINKKLTFSLTFKFKKLESTFSRFSKSSNLYGKYRWQRIRKCSVVSTSLLHAHIAFIISPKPCLNLYSFRWLNWSLRQVRSLTRSGS